MVCKIVLNLFTQLGDDLQKWEMVCKIVLNLFTQVGDDLQKWEMDNSVFASVFLRFVQLWVGDAKCVLDYLCPFLTTYF